MLVSITLRLLQYRMVWSYQRLLNCLTHRSKVSPVPHSQPYPRVYAYLWHFICSFHSGECSSLHHLFNKILLYIGECKNNLKYSDKLSPSTGCKKSNRLECIEHVFQLHQILKVGEGIHWKSLHRRSILEKNKTFFPVLKRLFELYSVSRLMRVIMHHLRKWEKKTEEVSRGMESFWQVSAFVFYLDWHERDRRHFQLH